VVVNNDICWQRNENEAHCGNPDSVVIMTTAFTDVTCAPCVVTGTARERERRREVVAS
jgi:hypothetical protein